MSDRFVIQWKSRTNGRAGRGSKTFEREQAQLLAAELNQDYPDIEHSAVPAPAEGSAPKNPEQSSKKPNESSQAVIVE